jgi:uncharacterized protein
MTRFLAVTGGHSVDIDAFRAMLDSISNDREWQWAHAVQPSAQRWFNAKSPFDAIVCHDIPGLKLKRGVPPQSFDPDPQVVESMQSLFEAGTGLVILHHALAGWPTWDRWATALGGRFLYAPGELRSNRWPSSGTRITGYTARIETPEHPVVAGVFNFSLTDELYCCPVFDGTVHLDLRARHRRRRGCTEVPRSSPTEQSDWVGELGGQQPNRLYPAWRLGRNVWLGAVPAARRQCH